ncbi:MAG: NAD(P)/FAD-dependent oxidoreductase [Solirubrobacteraceae bacterium]
MSSGLDSTSRRVLIAGGGVAGLELMLALRELAPDQIDVTVLAAEEEFVYRPLSVAEPFALGEVRHYSVPDLCAKHGATFSLGRLQGVDGVRRVALLDAGEQRYDELVVALGADRRAVFGDALTFFDQRSTPGYRELLERVAEGRVGSIAFLVAPGVVWPFPLYELALMTSAFATDRGREVKLSLATPASAPLALFGERARQAMADLLTERGIEVHAGYDVRTTGEGRVLLEPDGPSLQPDHIVALPRLVGPRLGGLPHDPDGFIPVDEHGRVEGVEGVWAAGDCTTFPIKQGGIAAQQADTVAAALAAEAGTGVEPAPFRPVMRGMLLTGRAPTWLRASIAEGRAADSVAAGNALWWPPAKIAGDRLAPALGEIDAHQGAQDPADGVPVEVELETRPPAAPGVKRRAIIAHVRGESEPQILDLGTGGHGL